MPAYESTADWLAQWAGPRGGSGCDNPECPASSRYVRVLSIQELHRVYPRKRDLPRWPVPHQVTHVCDRCGELYGGQTGPFGFADRDRSYPELTPERFNWELADAWSMTVREAVETFVRNAPADCTPAELAEGVARFVPGADRALAREVLGELAADVDRLEAYSLAEFM